jgi:hypothetical protein
VLFVDPVGGEILDQPIIERAVGVERERSTQCGGVTGIRRRADVTQVGGGRDASDCAGVATAAKVAVLAVPRDCTCCSGIRDIDAVRRQADTDLELLALPGQISRRRTLFTREREIDSAVSGVRAARRQ